ncbi:hypothetical protein Pst134EA_007630 [Puccinia striiformis f. sp. tritici]|uniref:hypothetical protein n=1 Tax=Puccinia striiformis f. sp. tritici TaxID=168172 RepID=UPI002008A50A|nr:hypothetical protein Pst134EA_007630 [Puccinia striiformis f. sp. tritici]KAH9470368.1 hypothetical protein Pst134EA_007630 [Puccinia striiformis f. sp. tritici]
MGMEESKFLWEKKKYNDERAESSKRGTDKMAAAEKWLKEGKSPSDIEILLRNLF